MYIRIPKKSLFSVIDKRLLYSTDKSDIIVPISDSELENARRVGYYKVQDFKTYYDSKLVGIRSSVYSVELNTRLLYPDEIIKVKGKGDKIYKVVGGGCVMYRAEDSEGNVIRRNYVNKKGELTFELAPITEEEIHIEQSDGFNTFITAVKTNPKYQSDSYNKYIYKNYKAAVEAKRELREILSKHPNWNETQQCVEIPVSIFNKPSYSDINASCDELLNEAGKQPVFSFNSASSFRSFMGYASQARHMDLTDNVMKFSSWTKSCMSSLSVVDNINLDMKVSKVVSAVLNRLNIKRTHEIEKAFAKYADSVSTSSKDYKLILSINPADFVTMSHGNSWRSCHSFKDGGGWHAGCLSYALDNTTMIAYIIPKETSGVYALEPKIKRLLFMLSNDKKCLMSTKMYPDNSDSSARTIIDNTVLQIMNEAGLNISNEKLSSGFSFYTVGAHYPDYNYGYRNVFGKNDVSHKFNIGTKYYDFSTGEESQKNTPCDYGYMRTKLESITIMTEEIEKIIEAATVEMQAVSA